MVVQNKKTIYEGTFKEGLLEGEHCRVITILNSDSFNLTEGQFSRGVPHGWCRVSFTDRSVNDEVFEGVFVKGEQRGPGILV